MVVREIIELPKSRRKIVLDDGNVIVLYRNELSKLHIRLDEEIAESDYQRIMTEILPRRAKLRGLNLLQSRPYTEYQLRQKYMEGGYPEEIINNTIDYLKGLHLINDYEYAITYMTYRSSSKSRKRMINDLVRKGIDKDTIERALNTLIEEGDINEEDELIIRLLNKKHYNKEEASYEERQKIMSYLYSKGFSMDAIYRLTTT